MSRWKSLTNCPRWFNGNTITQELMKCRSKGFRFGWVFSQNMVQNDMKTAWRKIRTAFIETKTDLFNIRTAFRIIEMSGRSWQSSAQEQRINSRRLWTRSITINKHWPMNHLWSIRTWLTSSSASRLSGTYGRNTSSGFVTVFLTRWMISGNYFIIRCSLDNQ